jgi:formamidopyrimidine-DNA glycosylase
LPELPEVETIVRGLNRELAGRLCLSAEILTPSIVPGRGKASQLARELTGRRLTGVRRHGKAIFAAFEKPDAPAVTLRVHLGMTGQLLFERPDEKPAPHTHARFVFENHPRELRHRDIRRFGWLELGSGDTGTMGPDAWLAEPEVLFDTLRRRDGMAKAVLMNQAVLAGLGNIYVDESLHRAGLHPRAPLGRVKPDRLRALCDAIRVVLAESIELGGTSFRNYVDTEGSRGGFKGRLRVYGKEGTPCVCGTVIKKFVMGGRGTHFCPSCQPAPRRR